MTIKTYPAPSVDDLKAAREERATRRSGRPLKAALVYSRRATVEIEGLAVRMSITAAMNHLNLTNDMGTTIGMVVPHEDYERAVGEKLKQDRFVMFCEEDGIDPVKGSRNVAATCCVCGNKKPGVMLYAPDAMGYPTPVLKTCDDCLALANA